MKPNHRMHRTPRFRLHDDDHPKAGGCMVTSLAIFIDGLTFS
jgi:hypothetical protein